ncbi:MAG: hypothetical protein M3Q07_22830 [Pseudobdellovibrionaceae bacterium]|nr:hypothetical protein [Pseudobdellovibrionaceae bacterium]
MFFGAAAATAAGAKQHQLLRTAKKRAAMVLSHRCCEGNCSSPHFEEKVVVLFKAKSANYVKHN